MKKIKLITSLSALGAVGAIVPTVATGCSKDDSKNVGIKASVQKKGATTSTSIENGSTLGTALASGDKINLDLTNYKIDEPSKNIQWVCSAGITKSAVNASGELGAFTQATGSAVIWTVADSVTVPNFQAIYFAAWNVSDTTDPKLIKTFYFTNGTTKTEESRYTLQTPTATPVSSYSNNVWTLPSEPTAAWTGAKLEFKVPADFDDTSTWAATIVTWDANDAENNGFTFADIEVKSAVNAATEVAPTISAATGPTATIEYAIPSEANEDYLIKPATIVITCVDTNATKVLGTANYIFEVATK